MVCHATITNNQFCSHQQAVSMFDAACFFIYHDHKPVFQRADVYLYLHVFLIYYFSIIFY